MKIKDDIKSLKISAQED